MIDWIGADARMPTRLFNAAMAANTENHPHFWVRVKTVFGSFKITIHVKARRMSWDISPMKYLVGHNLFGTNRLDRLLLGILKLIYNRFNLTFTERDEAFYANEGVALSRLDLTASFLVGLQIEVVDTMYLLREHLLDHGQDIVVHEGPDGIETLYLGKNSSSSTVKFYNKYLELLANKKLLGLPYGAELLGHAKEVVRFEVILRAPYLKQRGLGNSKAWSVSTVRGLLEGKLHELGVSSPLLAELPDDVEAALTHEKHSKYSLWLAGNDMRQHYPAHTFNRDRKVFLEKGIDIARTHAYAQDAAILSERLSVGQMRMTWPERFVALGAVYR